MADYFGYNTMSRRRMAAPGVVNPNAPIANALADIASAGVGAAMYDPATDPKAQQARYFGAKADTEVSRLRGNQQFQSSAADVLAQLATNPQQAGQLLVGLAARTGQDPKDAAQWLTTAAAAAGETVTPQQFDRYGAAAGLFNPSQGYEMTGRGQDIDAATRRYEFDNTPEAAMGADGRPTFMPRAQLAGSGAAPIMSETDVRGTRLNQNFDNLPALNPQQQAALGVEPKIDARQPFNVEIATPQGTQNFLTYDGRTDTQGNPLPAGEQRRVDSSRTAAGGEGFSASGRNQLAQQMLSFGDFRDTLNMAREIAVQDPTIFGATGNVRRFAQSVTQQMANIGLLTGRGAQDLDTAYQEAMVNLADNGVNIQLLGGYDPNLNDIAKLATILTYNGASVFAGQEGRSVSDKDVQQFSSFVGDPRSWGSTQQSFLSGLNLMEQLLNQRENRRSQALGGQPAARSATPQPAAQPGPQAPASAPRRIRIDAQGNIVQ